MESTSIFGLIVNYFISNETVSTAKLKGLTLLVENSVAEKNRSGACLQKKSQRVKKSNNLGERIIYRPISDQM